MCRDGESHNLSWNCGEEGQTSSQAVLRLRGRQMRNLAAALLLAHGVPMIQMGDEYGHTKVCFAVSTMACRWMGTHWYYLQSASSPYTWHVNDFLWLQHTVGIWTG